MPGQLGTDTVLFGLYTSNGTTIINLVQDDDQIDTSQDLASIPLSDLNIASANEIEFTFTYTAPSGASDLVATFQLLDNGNAVGSPQSVGSATIFSSTDDFIIPTFGVHAPAPDSVLQGTYGTLGVLQNGEWAYILNPYTSQYQALDLGQMATDNFTIQLASLPGGSGTSTEPVTIDVVGVSPGLLNPIAQNTPQNATSPPGESITAIFTDSSVANSTSILTGIAIAQNPNSDGTWEYLINGGTWTPLPTVSPSEALVLAASDLIRFVPSTESFVGSVPPLIVYGLDGSYTGAFTSVSTPVDINVSDLATVGFTPLDTSVFSAAEVLQTAEWTNTSGGTWNTAGDWGTDSVPNNIDNLIIGDPGSYTVTIPSGSTAVASWLTLTNADATVLDEGTLTITQGLNVVAGVFQFSGGTLSDSGVVILGAGTIELGSENLALGTFVQSGGGTLSGTGTVTVTSSAAFDSYFNWDADSGAGEMVLQASSFISGYVALDGGWELHNQGTLDWTAGYIYLGYNPFGSSIGGGTLDNASGATFAILGDQGIEAWSGATAFTNEGLVVKTLATGITTIAATFNNTGAVDVDAGTLDFTGGVESLTAAGAQSTGSFVIGDGASLEFTGSVAAGSTVSFVSSTGSTGFLIVQDPSTFAGQVLIVKGNSGDVLDLGGFHSQTGDTFSVTPSFNGTSTTLTVTDVTESTSEAVTLVGNDTSSAGYSWSATSDGNGGANVVDPSVTSSSTTASADSFATVNGLAGTITFADVDAANVPIASFTAQGSGYIGTFGLNPVSEGNGSSSVAWQFNLNNDQINLAVNQTVTQSYEVSIGDPQNPTANMMEMVSASIGGPGNDNFIFRPGVGADTIVNFNPKADTIELDQFANVQSVEQLASLITADVHGAATIELGHNDSITIPGISQSYLQAHLESLVRLH